MANLADELRTEIYQQCLQNTKSFSDRRDYVVKQIKGGEREVFFSLSSWSDKQKPVSRVLLDKIGIQKEYELKTTGNGMEGHGIYYRNGKHYMSVVLREKEYPHTIIDEKEYCVEDEEGFWRVDYLYNREELLDVGSYFEKEGFRVSINLCSDHYARYPYKLDFFNICELIVSL